MSAYDYLNSVSQQQTKANICASTGSKATSIEQLNNCRSPGDTKNIQKFYDQVVDIDGDIETSYSTYTDLIISGDSIYGTSTNETHTQDVLNRNKKLKSEKEKLLNEIKENEAIIEQSSRDFIEQKIHNPGPVKKPLVSVIEDYSLFVAMMAFFFMASALIYLNMYNSNFSARSFIFSIIALAISSIFLFMIVRTFF
jgi:hypothetical protein